MALTLTDLSAAVLEEIGVLAAGSSPNAEDAAKVQSKYLQWLRTAQKRGIVDWYSDTDDIPDGAELGTTCCVCEYVATLFGVPANADWRFKGEILLADYMADDVSHPPTPGVFF